MRGNTRVSKSGKLVLLTFIALRCSSVGNSQASADASQPKWQVLFDGSGPSAWRGFRKPDLPDGWQVVDGALTRVSGGGDIVTRDQFGDFELELEWKLAAGGGGNSGIMYRVSETADATYMTGPEVQVLDDAGHRDGESRLTSAGSNYGLHAAPAGVVRPVGEWNQVRLVARGAHVQHWLNGQKVVEYELWSPNWEALVNRSKFAAWPGYGGGRRGHLALQDHGDWVAYRNIRIREIK